MVKNGNMVCPLCRGGLKRYDKVKRIVRSKYGRRTYIFVTRLRCTDCKSIHRQLSDNLFPYKQYDADIIRGVIEGFITQDTIGFEDYPSDVTMRRWRNQFNDIST